MLPGSLQVKSSIGYGAAMVVSVAFFCLFGPDLGGNRVLWIVGIIASLSALCTGWLFGRWYLPIGDDRPTFELVLCPILVLLLSLTIGLLALAGLGLATEPEPRPLLAVAAILGFGFPIFLVNAWPALVVSFGLVAIWLARLSRSAPNNSFKPTPLCGAA